MKRCMAASEKADAVLNVFALFFFLFKAFVEVLSSSYFMTAITPKTNWLQNCLFFQAKRLEYYILAVAW